MFKGRRKVILSTPDALANVLNSIHTHCFSVQGKCSMVCPKVQWSYVSFFMFLIYFPVLLLCSWHASRLRCTAQGSDPWTTWGIGMPTPTQPKPVCNFWLPHPLVVPRYPQGIGPRNPCSYQMWMLRPLMKNSVDQCTQSDLHICGLPITGQNQYRYLLGKESICKLAQAVQTRVVEGSTVL